MSRTAERSPYSSTLPRASPRRVVRRDDGVGLVLPGGFLDVVEVRGEGRARLRKAGWGEVGPLRRGKSLTRAKVPSGRFSCPRYPNRTYSSQGAPARPRDGGGEGPNAPPRTQNHRGGLCPPRRH